MVRGTGVEGVGRRQCQRHVWGEEISGVRADALARPYVSTQADFQSGERAVPDLQGNVRQLFPAARRLRDRAHEQVGADPPIDESRRDDQRPERDLRRVRVARLEAAVGGGDPGPRPNGRDLERPEIRRPGEQSACRSARPPSAPERSIESPSSAAHLTRTNALSRHVAMDERVRRRRRRRRNCIAGNPLLPRSEGFGGGPPSGCPGDSAAKETGKEVLDRRRPG